MHIQYIQYPTDSTTSVDISNGGHLDESGSQWSMNTTTASSPFQDSNILEFFNANLTMSDVSTYDFKMLDNSSTSTSTNWTSNSFGSATSLPTNGHRKISLNNSYPTRITNDRSTSAVSQPLVSPTLKDAILETDTFYPWVNKPKNSYTKKTDIHLR